MYCIENNELKVTFDPMGAEIKEVFQKNTGKTLMHDGAHFWGYTAPVLFPITGTLKGGYYTHKGKEYRLKPHGLGRISEFTFCGQTADSITFSLSDSPQSFTDYPFRFVLSITYRVAGPQLEVTYRVENKSDEVMYFSIGSHEAYRCPTGGRSFFDYYVEFETEEDLGDHLMVDNQTARPGNGEKTFAFTKERFEEGHSWFFRNLNSKSAALKTKDGPVVRVDFDNQVKSFGLWQYKGSDFICLEPWYGIPEECQTTHVLSEKKDMMHLDPGGCFNASHTITFYELPERA